METGGTLRSNKEESAKKPGPFGDAARKELEGPECPWELEYLVLWFRELQLGRRYAVVGTSVQPEAISWLDIMAWSELTGRKPEPQEVLALMELDGWSRNPGKPDKPEDNGG